MLLLTGDDMRTKLAKISSFQKKCILCVISVTLLLCLVLVFVLMGKGVFVGADREGPETSIGGFPVSRTVQDYNSDLGRGHNQSKVKENDDSIKWVKKSINTLQNDSRNSGLSQKDLNEPHWFVQENWKYGMPYDFLQACIQKEEVPVLHDMLGDAKYRPYWPIVALVIGKISRDVNSVPLIVEYIKRDDSDVLTSDMARIKMALVRNLGIIGGVTAKETLKWAATEDGAMAMLDKWIDEDIVIKTWKNRENAIRSFRGAALDGLSFLREEDSNKFIEGLYYKEVKKHQEKIETPFLSYLVDSMAIKDCLKEMDIDEWIETEMSGDFNVLIPYIQKYSPTIREKIEQNKDIMDKLKKGREEMAMRVKKKDK